jgi:hypothetical protein
MAFIKGAPVGAGGAAPQGELWLMLIASAVAEAKAKIPIALKILYRSFIDSLPTRRCAIDPEQTIALAFKCCHRVRRTTPGVE